MSETDFDDILFPLSFSLGASAGPEWRTEIVTLESGAEVRNARWSGSRRRWDVGGAVASPGDLETLMRFFEERRGRLRGFRLADPFEHSSAGQGQAVTPTDQQIAIGDGVQHVFQLKRSWGPTAKPVTKPREGSVRVAIDGSGLVSGWSLDPLTGEVAFDTPPVPGAAITAGFLFDWPVRFDTDRLDITYDLIGAGRALSLPVIELV